MSHDRTIMSYHNVNFDRDSKTVCCGLWKNDSTYSKLQDVHTPNIYFPNTNFLFVNICKLFIWVARAAVAAIASEVLNDTQKYLLRPFRSYLQTQRFTSCEEEAIGLG